VAIAGTWAFAEVAEHVRSGGTQRFDDAVLTWVGAHQLPWLQSVAVEVTALGTASVVIMIALIAALFLALSPHRYWALLLIAATVGGLLLNGVLKLIFDRPRPEIFAWGTHAVSSSFPSGHAMNAVIVYSTVGYLAARLESRRWIRWVTLSLAAAVIVLVCLTRLYLGVHYPSDVAAGLLVGLAWAAFCMSGLEAARVFGRRFRRDAEPGGEPKIR
jgi:undecaprenyl-diphosphatase